MSCDHVIGTHGPRLVRKSQWVATAAQFAVGLHFCNTSEKDSVPHPGYLSAHAHCVDCGAKLDKGAALASISESISEAVDACIGSGTTEPLGAGLTRDVYLEWTGESVPA